jgi:signal transduction histidine kinase
MDITFDTPLRTALEEVQPHSHLSLIYESPEDHFAVAIPFVQIGLERGEKCIYIADDGTEAVVRDAMRAGNIDVDRAIGTGSLVLGTKERAYLKRGSFDPEWMPAFWKNTAAEAMQQGFPALRMAAETEWVLSGAPGLDRWVEYEARLTHVLAGLNCFALCQYNRAVLPPEILLDVIRTHPTVIYRGIVCRNMYHVPPDELLASNQTALEAERLLTTLRERAEAEYTLRQQRNELRTLANHLMHVQDDERRRIATMLHDTTAQDLAALKMMLARLSQASDRLDDGERNALIASLSLVDQSIAEIRTVSYLLHPPLLDTTGLVSAIRWYVEGFAERSGVRVNLDLPEDFERLPRETETVVFRIIQESLTNIHRHAKSETASIRLRRQAGGLVLEIEDRGHGISNALLEHITSGGGGGVGIAGMRERAQQLGGSLEVTSSSTGMTVRVWLPAAIDR